MNVQDFRRIVTAFADSAADVDLAKGTLVTQVRDELISASVSSREGEIFVTEDGQTQSAGRWVVQRVARLPLLAERILAHVPDEPAFVSPDGYLLDEIDSVPGDQDQYAPNATETLLGLLDRKPVEAASVVYLTSDAGEGKTTVISHLARTQARRYKEKKADWLLVPVPLGGRTFMRFDDVIVGALYEPPSLQPAVL